MKLTDDEIRDINRHLELEADKSLPEKYCFLLFEDKKEVELVWNGNPSVTKKKHSLELKSAFVECVPGRRKVVVKMVDILVTIP